ncbi:hypothetical protein CNR34_00110 [Pseudomonas phage nickie]|uniref:Uncharacterized protein n=1 Tax=Pseudomonas phage nickie TaxID=2048977 RepID=A0A2H4P769_9CAUD|nr:hypothetical protein FDJ16_gp055 [Pseudomonas phage nickie]ATW58043.1 hypothetical protein CNR34_00110 [Pseudomonas phage nickie]
MKIVGKAKGKAPKAWSLMKDTVTGHYYVGWDGHWPLNGPADSVNASAAAARAALGPEPDLGVDVAWPGFHIHGRPAHATPLTQQQLDDWAAYEASNKRKYAHNEWRKQKNISQVEALDYVPIFEDVLEFQNYSRGRSSVTLVFKASNGQFIEFGPSGIDGLIRGIIDGVAAPQFIAGSLEKGIKARFKFVKKGANTYAELTEE